MNPQDYQNQLRAYMDMYDQQGLGSGGQSFSTGGLGQGGYGWHPNNSQSINPMQRMNWAQQMLAGQNQAQNQSNLSQMPDFYGQGQAPQQTQQYVQPNYQSQPNPYSPQQFNNQPTGMQSEIQNYLRRFLQGGNSQGNGMQTGTSTIGVRD